MSKQILKSGTSIGANVREAEFVISKLNFINKMSFCLKEANKTDWLDLLNCTDFIEDVVHNDLKEKNQEILRLLVSIVKSSKNNS